MHKEYILLNGFRKAKRGFTAGFHVPWETVLLIFRWIHFSTHSFNCLFIMISMRKYGEKIKVIFFPRFVSMKMAAIFDVRALPKVHITLKPLLQMQWKVAHTCIEDIKWRNAYTRVFSFVEYYILLSFLCVNNTQKIHSSVIVCHTRSLSWRLKHSMLICLLLTYTNACRFIHLPGLFAPRAPTILSRTDPTLQLATALSCTRLPQFGIRYLPPSPPKTHCCHSFKAALNTHFCASAYTLLHCT